MPHARIAVAALGCHMRALLLLPLLLREEAACAHSYLLLSLLAMLRRLNAACAHYNCSCCYA
jgi:hypothetical protein